MCEVSHEGSDLNPAEWARVLPNCLSNRGQHVEDFSIDHGDYINGEFLFIGGTSLTFVHNKNARLLPISHCPTVPSDILQNLGKGPLPQTNPSKRVHGDASNVERSQTYNGVTGRLSRLKKQSTHQWKR